MEGLVGILGIVALVAEIMAAVEFNSIANQKGYEGTKYGWWCALFPPAGYLMVIALPNLNQQAAPVQNSAAAPAEDDVLPEL